MDRRYQPCPFCGGTDISLFKPTCRPETPYNPADRLYPWVRCNTCYAEVVGESRDYAGDTAAAAWNTRDARATIAQLRAQIAEERERCAKVCETVETRVSTFGTYIRCKYMTATECAAAIRALPAPPAQEQKS